MSVKETSSLYIHDFGVIRPQSEQEYVFSIKNPTAIDWNIHKIVQNCSCTVVTPLLESIPAGGSLDAKMSYRAGKELADDLRDSIIQFEQPDVPPITLRVKAQIRPQLVFQPKQVHFSVYIPNKKYNETVVVHDWSDNGLQTVKFHSDDTWIVVAPPKKNTAIVTDALFTPWESLLTVDSTNLSPGKYQGRITIVAKDKKLEYTTFIPVVLDVGSIVRAIPSNLFFGEVDFGEETVITSTLLVPPVEKIGIQTDLWNSMMVESDFPKDVLRVEMMKETESKGKLTVFLTPQSFGNLKGNIFLKFNNNQFHQLSLPVIAHVKGEPITPSFKEIDNAKIK
jgi:hypothetical protein